MGDLKVGEGFIDAVMIRVTATGAAALGLAPTCTLTRLSTGARVGLTVAEVSDGIYKVTDMAPAADDEYLTEWAVAGANTIYTAFKLFKVGGGVIADWEDGGRLDLIIDAILADTVTIAWGDITGIVNDIGVFPTANYATVAAYVEDIRTRLIAIVADTGAIVWGDITGIIADIGVFPTANYATLAAYVENVRTRLITIEADTNEIQISLADGGFTDLLIDSIIERTSNLPDDPADASDIATAHGLLATEAKQDIIDGLIDDIIADIGVFPSANYATFAAYVEDIRTRLIAIVEDTGTTLENRQVTIATKVAALTNTELFGSVMQEELQIAAAAADKTLPDVILPNITGTIQRAYLHFKCRMVENTYAGVNKLEGAQSIRIKKDGGAWGVDDIAAITFVDDMVQLAASTREGGDVWGGAIDISGEVDAFNDTYEIRWEDADADQDFINFNDIEMFLRVVWI